MTMTIKPIRNDDDHREAVEEIRALWNARPGTEVFDRLDVLATLVDSYERKRWPVDKLDPVEAIEAVMEADGHTQAELASLIGKNRASEVRARKRPLTLGMIRTISAAWHLPTSVLVKEYALSK
jgi:HTH-type transcriptional regulator / antitoxin HigA